MASTKRRGYADLPGHVRGFLKPRLFPAARLCLGYSGGLDSSVLLHLLAALRGELAFELSAVHVHHGLSVHADAWAEHCRQACARLDVPLAVRPVEVVAGGLGLEAAAREARYRVYAEQAADFIVLAHQRDDQAETLLFRFLRGAGVHGLAAMADQRGAQGRTLLRPLLAVPRHALRAFADEHRVGHIEDDSNADLALTRNWLRHAVFPLLEERFPAARQVFARTAGQLHESAELLDALALADLGAVRDGPGLRLDALVRLGSARARNLLRFWLRQEAGAVPNRAWLDDAWLQLTGARPDRHPALVFAGRRLCRRGEHILLADLPPAAAPGGQWHWRGEAELVLGGHGRLLGAEVAGAGLAARWLLPDGARIAWRTGGERLRPDCRRPARTLKNLLREGGVPVEARGRLPLLYVGDRLAWAAGLGVDCAFQAAPGEPGWLISWCPSGPPGR
jgi:tRNA(Ile)-lysidine synthase